MTSIVPESLLKRKKYRTFTIVSRGLKNDWNFVLRRIIEFDLQSSATFKS